MSGLGQTPLSVSCGADSSFPGSEDGTPDPQRTKQAIAQLQQKILKLTEQIKIEQTARDDNVAEYLKLANNADKQQSTRIKQVKEESLHPFELLLCILIQGTNWLGALTTWCDNQCINARLVCLVWSRHIMK